MKPKIEPSPWTLKVNPANQKKKLEYCQRMIAWLKKTVLTLDPDTRPSAAFGREIHLWHQRINWINANKL